MIGYPAGIKKKVPAKNQPLKTLKVNSYKNRGMNFENEINLSNQFYLQAQRAVITKRPTPNQCGESRLSTRGKNHPCLF